MPEGAEARWRLLAVLGALSAFAPLSMDMYLPALPQLAVALHTSDSLAQLTMSSCVVGLGLGQLLAGPFSDQAGRRRPLLGGIALYVLASLACAFAHGIGVLIALRCLQGLTGGTSIVIARAVVRDLYGDDDVVAARLYSLLSLVMLTVPILAPVIGGQVLRFTDWRGVFVALALVGLAVMAATSATLPETLPPPERHRGGLARTGRAFATVARDRLFVAYAAVLALAGTTLFTYISVSPFVIQGSYGASAQRFSLIFAANGAGMLLTTRANATLVSRFGPARMLAAAVVACAASTLLLLTSVLFHLGLAGLLPPLFLTGSSIVVIMPNAMALAMVPHSQNAGTASGLLGVLQFLASAAISPLAAIGGATPTSMAAIMAACALGALAIHLLLVAPQQRAAAALG